jgi:hypothetical protein
LLERLASLSFVRKEASPMSTMVAIDWQPIADVFSWAGRPGGLAANWPTGLMMFGAGIVGGLVTIYATDPDQLPRLGGSRDLQEARARLAESRTSLLQSRDDLQDQVRRDSDSSRRKALQRLCESLRSDCRMDEKALVRLRRSASYRGFPIFVLLGGVIAVSMASTILHAALIGVGWPAALQGLVIRRERNQIKEASRDEITKLGNLLEARDDAIVKRDQVIDQLSLALSLIGGSGGSPSGRLPE